MRARTLAAAGLAVIIGACTDVADPTRAFDPNAQTAALDSSASLRLARPKHKAAGDIAADPNELDLAIGESFQLTTRAVAWGGKPVIPKAVHFTTRNAGVATVDAAGKITGVGKGTVYIDVTADGDFVRYDPDSVKVNVAGGSGTTDAEGGAGTGDQTAGSGDSGSTTTTDPDKSTTGSTGSTTTDAGGSTGSTTTDPDAGGSTGSTTTDPDAGSTGGTTTSPPTTPTTPPVVISPGSNAGMPHEPSGMTVLTSRPFFSKAATTSDRAGSEGWDPIEGRYSNFSVVSDPTAPYSGSGVGQMKYPAGMAAGIAPATAQVWFQKSYRTLYISMWVKLSSNFSGNQTSTNKMFHMWINNGNRLFLSAEGAFMSGLKPEVRLQGVPDTRARILPNVKTNALVQRGVWQRWELVLVSNTPGQPNGIAQWWIDGQLVTDVRDLMITRSGESNLWQQFQWSPTFGGGGAAVPNTQYLWFDHVYVSGK